MTGAHKMPNIQTRTSVHFGLKPSGRILHKVARPDTQTIKQLNKCTLRRADSTGQEVE